MNKSTSIIIAIVVLLGVFSFVYFKNNTVEAPTLQKEALPNATSTTTMATTTITPTPATPAVTVKTYTLAEVSTHNNKSDCWSVVNAEVYNLTTWIGSHPGGEKAILSICGKDGSVAFNGKHSGQAPQAAQLAKFKIGIIR